MDGLRALAALYVVCVHLLPRAWGDTPPQSAALRLLAKLLSEGHFAVTTFIVISGFCLALPMARAGGVLRGGPAVFFKRRFWRIAPPLYFAFALAALLLQAGRGNGTTVPAYYPDTHVTATQWLAHALLLQNLIPGGLLPNNGALWSITVECLIYLWFPLLVLLWRRIGPTRATAAFVAIGYVLYAALKHTLLAPATPQYLGAFALGSLAAGIAYAPTVRWITLRGRIPWYPLALAGFALVIGLCAVLGWRRLQDNAALLDLPIALGTSALLIGASQPGRNRVRDALQIRPLASVGVFSYSLYMIHYPIADVLCNYILRPLHLSQYGFVAGVILFVIPLVLLIAYGFYRLCEKPFHEIAKRAG